MRAGIYARISLDRQDGEGVARQVDDCRALAAELGWEVAAEYVDNDISAYSGKRRPEYRRMVADLEAGAIGGVLAYHTDRLYRLRRDLAEFVDVVKAANAQVRTVKSGEVDLSTASGRLIAAQLGSIGIYESERMGERVSRAKRERAIQGRPSGGGLRPFGYQDDKITLHPTEADLVRDAAERVAAGGSIWTEARAWNAAGVTTTAGNPWEVSAVRRVLTSPRVAGIRTYRGDEMGPATWPAIIGRDTHDLLRAMTASRKRGRPPAPSWLLSGLIPCPKCGRVLYGSTRGHYRAYACAPSPGTERGCGGASVSANACDAKVLGEVRSWLADPPDALTIWLAGPASSVDLAGEQEAIRSQRGVLTKRYAAGKITEEDLDDALEVMSLRLEEIERSVPTPSPGFTVADVLRAWDNPENSPELRKPIIGRLAALTLSPERMPDPADRLTVTKRWT